jgi:PAS domain S-box-containing protein
MEEARVNAMDERLYRQLVEGSPDAIILGDAHGVIQLWNAGAETIFGFSAAEAVGQSMDLIVPERLRARHWSGYDRVMATGVSRYGQGELLAVPATTKDGRTISIEFTIQMLRDAAGAVVGPVAIIRDVSKRFQREKELGRRLKELEAQVRGRADATASSDPTRG